MHYLARTICEMQSSILFHFFGLQGKHSSQLAGLSPVFFLTCISGVWNFLYWLVCSASFVFDFFCACGTIPSQQTLWLVKVARKKPEQPLADDSSCTEMGSFTTRSGLQKRKEQKHGPCNFKSITELCDNLSIVFRKTNAFAPPNHSDGCPGTGDTDLSKREFGVNRGIISRRNW